MPDDPVDARTKVMTMPGYLNEYTWGTFKYWNPETWSWSIK